ncbi:MAG: hypothetical protein CSB21_02720 [Deltaproteobacteria bacterium]|nr:MAG: hypothetical protein CSB21_02720 [Deltaproteobacteria bacterium]
MGCFSKDIFSIIKNSSSKHTLNELVKICRLKYNIGVADVKKTMRELVERGDIEYINVLGNTFPVVSFSKAARLSVKIIVCPPDISPDKDNPDDIIIRLEKTTSFGRGDHPTTRLSLAGCEKFFSWREKKGGYALDMGCGTGILAMASVFMGIEKAYGVDIDPVAVFDAEKNILLNNLEEKVFVSNTWPEQIYFDLIFANLRPPTLFKFRKKFESILYESGGVVISGYKKEEEKSVLDEFSKSFGYVKSWSEKKWCSALFYGKEY